MALVDFWKDLGTNMDKRKESDKYMLAPQVNARRGLRLENRLDREANP